MEKNVRLSEKHGVNPSIRKCFYCGAEKGIVLLGKLPGDEQAPKYGIYDLEPCENCPPEIQNPAANNTYIFIEHRNDEFTGRYVAAEGKNISPEFFENNEGHIFIVTDLDSLINKE